MRSLRDTEATERTPPSALTLLVGFGGLSASLAAGYGVLFTIVADFRNEYGISETSIGVVIGIGFLTAVFSQIFIGPLADRGHARQVVIGGVVVNVLGLLLMAAGTSLTPILIGRIISGIGIGAAVPAVKRIVIVADPDNLGQNMGRLFAADVFGFAMGPAISAALVGPFGIAAPFIVVAAITVILLPLVVRIDVAETTDIAARRLAVDLLRSRAFAGAVVLGTATYVMIGAFDALWDVVHDDLGTSDWIANLGITLFALPLVFLGPIGGRLAQTWGPFRLGTVGLLFAAVLMASYGWWASGGLIFAVAMVHAASDGMTFTAPGVAVGMTAPQQRQAGAQGMLGASQAVGAGITAPLTGWLYQSFGRETAYGVAAGIMVVMVLTGVWLAQDAWRITRPLAR